MVNNNEQKDINAPVHERNVAGELIGASLRRRQYAVVNVEYLQQQQQQH